MTYKEAKKVIELKVKEAEDLISECESLANEHQIGFNWELAYGMGGYFEPAPLKLTRAQALEIIEKGEEISPSLINNIKYALESSTDEEGFADYWSSSSEGGWMSSSAQC